MVKLTNFDHLTTAILKFWPRSWYKMANFDHLTTVILKFWPWSWSKIFDHLTMTSGRTVGQMVKKSWSFYPPPTSMIVNSKRWRKNDFFHNLLTIFSNFSRSTVNHEPISAGPLALAREMLLENPEKPFFVLNADVVCGYPFKNMLDFHSKHGCEGTICVSFLKCFPVLNCRSVISHSVS